MNSESGRSTYHPYPFCSAYYRVLSQTYNCTCHVCNPDFPVRCYHLLQVKRSTIPTLMKSTFRDPLDPLVSQVWEGCMIQGKGSEDISGEMWVVWTVPPRTANVLEITARAWLQSEFFSFFFFQITFSSYISQKSTRKWRGQWEGFCIMVTIPQNSKKCEKMKVTVSLNVLWKWGRRGGRREMKKIGGKRGRVENINIEGTLK